MLYVKSLIWDDWNVAHIARHNVRPEDVTSVCERRHIVRESYDERVVVIGTNASSNLLTVAEGQ